MRHSRRGETSAFSVMAGFLLVAFLVYIGWRLMHNTDTSTKSKLQEVKEQQCRIAGGACTAIVNGVSCTAGQENVSNLAPCPNVYGPDDKPTDVQQDCCFTDPSAKQAISACQSQGGVCEYGDSKTVAGAPVTDCLNGRVKLSADCPAVSGTPQVCCKAAAP